jgi:hypothetical protein
LAVVVVVGAEVVLVVELPRVAFVAYCTVKEADCCGERVVSLGGVSLGAREREGWEVYWWHYGGYTKIFAIAKDLESFYTV